MIFPWFFPFLRRCPAVLCAVLVGMWCLYPGSAFAVVSREDKAVMIPELPSQQPRLQYQYLDLAVSRQDLLFANFSRPGRAAEIYDRKGAYRAQVFTYRGADSRGFAAVANPGTPSELNYGGTLAVVLAFYAAIWATRRTCRTIGRIITVAVLAEIVMNCIDCPWLLHCSRTTTRKERRKARLREPPLPSEGAAVYRSDGASRKNGWGIQCLAGAGAAYWRPGSRGGGEPQEKWRAYLDAGVTNNVAEYEGLLASMRRAARKSDKEVIFEVDSMLLARQIGHAWACRSPTLTPYYEKCLQLGDTLDGLVIRDWNGGAAG